MYARADFGRPARFSYADAYGFGTRHPSAAAWPQKKTGRRSHISPTDVRRRPVSAVQTRRAPADGHKCADAQMCATHVCAQENLPIYILCHILSHILQINPFGYYVNVRQPIGKILTKIVEKAFLRVLFPLF